MYSSLTSKCKLDLACSIFIYDLLIVVCSYITVLELLYGGVADRTKKKRKKKAESGKKNRPIDCRITELQEIKKRKIGKRGTYVYLGV